MTGPLLVWLDGEPVAKLTDVGLGMGAELTYLPEAVDRYGPGAYPLSVRLPVRSEPYPAVTTRPFLDGLLPEDQVRSALAERARVPVGDTLALLMAYGLDCAGAVQIATADMLHGRTPSVVWLGQVGLADAIETLPSAPLGTGVDPGVRASLGGVQGKLPVVCDGDRIGVPIHGQPSTHLLKPSRLTAAGREQWPGLVAVEALCMRLVAACHDLGGALPAAHVDVLMVADRQVLRVRRYDRRTLDGRTTRLHQEDGAQAIGSQAKYQRNELDPPRFTDVAQVLNRYATVPARERLRLLELVTISVAVGNADLHARNVSLLLNGGVTLAPAYDVVATAAWPDLNRELALRVAGEAFLDDVTGEHLVIEAGRWGIRPSAARRTIRQTLHRLTTALPQVVQRSVAEGWHIDLLHDVAADIERRIQHLQA